MYQAMRTDRHSVRFVMILHMNITSDISLTVTVLQMTTCLESQPSASLLSPQATASPPAYSSTHLSVSTASSARHSVICSTTGYSMLKPRVSRKTPDWWCWDALWRSVARYVGVCICWVTCSSEGGGTLETDPAICLVESEEGTADDVEVITTAAHVEKGRAYRRDPMRDICGHAAMAAPNQSNRAICKA